MTTTHKDISDWTRVSGRLGTQPGGTYEAPDGVRYYVKHSKSEDHARNEVLASRLYALAGVATVRQSFVMTEHGLGVASRWIPEARAYLAHRLHDTAYVSKIRAGFAVDAWLANWDTVGLEFDNIVSDADDNPVRVDLGGCLLFRAMGDPKGRLFSAEAGELDTLRSRAMNPQSFELFGRMTDAEIRESAKSLESVSPALIRETVLSVGFDEVTAEYVIARLLNRRDDILARVS